jgi:beta-lactamase superfamily II metal-dependent hydrolase
MPSKRNREQDTGSGNSPNLGIKTRPVKIKMPKDLRDIIVVNQRRDDLEEEKKAAKEQAESEAAAAAAARAKELATYNPAPAGTRGDGSLHIAFVRVGQGDCTIISTPKGQIVMIDCGSDSTEAGDGHEFGAVHEDKFTEIAHDTLYSKKFLGEKAEATNSGNNRIDILILTHPNTDHYNKVSKFLREDVKIQSCYHSGKFVSYSYTNNWIRSRIIGGAESSIKAVTANEAGATDTTDGTSYKTGKNGTRQIGSTALVAQDQTTRTDRLDARRAIRILEEDNCKISILSSNVKLTSETDGSDETNRGSIVTLIEVFDRKFLICGDATTNTEKFLRKAYPALTNLDVLQIPHHGSQTSSSEAFINVVKPSLCVASTGKNVPKDHLPRQVVLARYSIGRMPDNAVDVHTIYHWVSLAMGGWAANSEPFSTKRSLYTTGSNGTLTLKVAYDDQSTCSTITRGTEKPVPASR